MIWMPSRAFIELAIIFQSSSEPQKRLNSFGVSSILTILFESLKRTLNILYFFTQLFRINLSSISWVWPQFLTLYFLSKWFRPSTIMIIRFLWIPILNINFISPFQTTIQDFLRESYHVLIGFILTINQYRKEILLRPFSPQPLTTNTAENSLSRV